MTAGGKRAGRPPPLRSSGAGFTLLELLVGLVVLGFILAGLTQGVSYGLRASSAQARLVDGRGELDAVDRALRRLLAEADPGNSHDPPLLQGGPARLAFVSTLPAAVAGAGQEADIALGVDGAHRLMLHWTPHLHAQRIGPPPAPQEAELLRGVDHLEIAYWLNGWQSSWTRATLPELIRVRIVFGADDPRHWPDIVAAPLRQRVG